jgi:leader peptidase (prepilin peptidase)/N-methyltransferase
VWRRRWRQWTLLHALRWLDAEPRPGRQAGDLVRDALVADVVTGWLAPAWLVAWTVPLAIADIRTRRLPTAMVNRLLAGLVVLSLVGGLVSGSVLSIIWSFIGAAAFGGLLVAVRLAAGDALGGGDVRLAVPLGWFLGRLALRWTDIVALIAMALLVSAVGALLTSAVRRRWREPLAFGPWLCLGALLVGMA